MELKPGYKQTEVGVIPEDWNLKALGEMAELTSSKRIFKNDYVSFGIPFYRGKEISMLVEGKTIDDICYISEERFNTIVNQFSAPTRGDILITAVGTLGNIYVVNTDEPFYFKDGNLIWLRSISGVEPTFLGIQLRRSKTAILNGAIGSSQKALTIVVLRDLIVVIPPIHEQRAISNALSDVDALLSVLDRLIAKKRDLKQAVMQQLLTGQTRLPGFHDEWEVTRLGDVATFYKGKGLPKSALNLFGAELCIHYGELFTRYPETITEIISRTDDSGVTFRSIANDVLMPTSDVTPRGLAKASCIRSDGIILGGDILVIRSDTKLIFGSFLSYLIRYKEEQVLQLVTGSTVFHLYGSDMKKFKFSMPSLLEQKAIIAVLMNMDAELAKLEQRRNKTRSLKQAMMQELLTGRTRLI